MRAPRRVFLKDKEINNSHFPHFAYLPITTHGLRFFSFKR